LQFRKDTSYDEHHSNSLVKVCCLNKRINHIGAKTKEKTEVFAIDSKNFDFSGGLCYTDDALKEGCT